MTLYLDTSLLVAALTNEFESARIQNWLAKQAAGSLAISEWVETEFSSALSLKLRTQQIEAAHRVEALAMFVRLKSESLLLLPITGPQFRTATYFVDQFRLGLRAGDALHLAVCAEHGATLCSLDRRLVEAGPPLGIKTDLI